MSRLKLPLLPCLICVVLAAAGCQSMRAVARGTSDLFNRKKILSTAMALEKGTPDQRRDAIYWLVERPFGRKSPYTDRYQQIARDDSDYLVRASAIRALNIARDTSATDVFIAALSDPEQRVRLEAAKALVNLPDPASMPKLVEIVGRADEDKDVRIAAAEALRHYRNIEVARALAGQLTDRDFGIAWQARRSLVRMTGKDLQYDEVAWLNYFTSPGRPVG